MLAEKREKLFMHHANREYVARFHERLRHIRGTKSQMTIACMADVAQSYISRVESGTTNGIGPAALQRILTTYKELEHVSGHR